jgi:tetratricopeptide (TPR) repeat protein
MNFGYGLVPDSSAPQYVAFLSYSHGDTRMARRVHAHLEGFTVDKDLVGRGTARGAIPRTLQPIFRDRHDFEAGDALADQTLRALDRSAALIVLATPRAAQSHYVNDEVRLFKSRHPDRLVIPLIAEGTPGGGTDECFPPALRFAVAPDGTVTTEPVSILAADLREAGDGFALALAKVVARLLGLPPDEIYRRAERERRRHARQRNAVFAAFAVLVLAGSGLFWQSHRQQATLSEIGALVEKYSPVGGADARELGGTRSLTEALTAIVNGAATDPRYAQALTLLKTGRAAEAEPLLKAVAEEQSKRATNDARNAAAAYRNLAAIAAVSDHKRAREYYTEAARLDPTDAESMLQAGLLEREAGRLADAEADYGRVLGMPTVGDDARCRAYIGLGIIRGDHGDFVQALARFREATRLATSYAKADAGNRDWQHILARSVREQGLILEKQNQFDEAHTLFETGRSIDDGLVRSDPSDASAELDLSNDQQALGDTLIDQEKPVEALVAYQAVIAVRERLAASDPSNLLWQRLLSTAYVNVGIALRGAGAYP